MIRENIPPESLRLPREPGEKSPKLMSLMLFAVMIEQYIGELEESLKVTNFSKSLPDEYRTSVQILLVELKANLCGARAEIEELKALEGIDRDPIPSN